MHGKVYLVGAGPGDPELLTLRALYLLQHADAVVYDRLVSRAIMSCINPEATLHDVGKVAACKPSMQDDINDILLSLSRTHQRVIRLKGGDPFIFGRGGEEQLYLQQHGVRAEVVPGITAATGCAASLGIPLTHRGLASSVRFITGHLRDNQGLELNWASLSDPTCTLVFYMAMANCRHIAQALIQHGRSPHTPIALAQDATLKSQRWGLGTLQTLPQLAQTFSPPALLIIGQVVQLHPDYPQPTSNTQDALTPESSWALM
ncbi:MAG: uroporphyrinogen-III C-methyltransferase [Alcaligenes faecalis]|jgi:uroporphyrin-III C-methyltransferase|uniref:uroporphyrinogen-III C-methyltransferase n=1 Tax=Alcaligenes aquatilis TaxID=323284 RepID=A0A3G2HVW4_9BURK|nr:MULTISPECIES: uroporphyrinogen-III C-methyltransferase [Alcaligenes]AWG34784.1 uroporphyrinogen-III C-methyltransferase [Alcaligenes aquatilis]AYN21193.1 uroporphyrinogen-III C-methyltransferase [Alcaligenes aquatilis]MCC9162291.1 uroporphyrinogen-III C-methyltransferase [Alcaligenes sp. MMA]MCH4225359.1 uroporphyrinogen-III C-methyltransferase [Alcaligenes faecalis]HBQ88508.1 uroporphyrinogen-III C-methyltransferase [Alcaligenes faecalis]